MIHTLRSFVPRAFAALLAFAFVTTTVSFAIPNQRVFRRGESAARKGTAPKLLEQFITKDGRKISVYEGYFAEIVDTKHNERALRYLPHVTALMTAMARSKNKVPDRKAVLNELAVRPPAGPFVDGQVLVVLRQGFRFSADSVKPSNEQVAAMRVQKRVAVAYPYSNDMNLNRVLSGYAASEADHLFTGVGDRISSMRSRAANASSILPIENTYVVHFKRGHVRQAVTELRALPSVAYAGENLRVSTTTALSVPLSETRLALARTRSMRPPALGAQPRPFGARVGNVPPPANYDVASSGQSFLNAPGVNALAAYDEVEKQFSQLPGAGEIITNVSLGDVDDGVAPNDPCTQYITSNEIGPTAIVIGNQHYLDFPSLPLIPAYTASQGGKLDGMGEVCGVDPILQEVGLDFSVMAALPHHLQRPGMQGAGLFDLMGVAPGATYRLVVPASSQPASDDLAGALLGAALQYPTPNVITASIGFGNDAFGFPSRYLEEDPILRSVVASIVAQGIVVCISSGDGLRTYTNAAVNPSGGTVPIEAVRTGGTDATDDQYSTIPSEVQDTGAIAVGGTTLDDVTTGSPYWTPSAVERNQQTYPEVRWNGLGGFASGYGSRVNISAPSDNILSVYGYSTASGISITGGTSASAPMVAAAAAVAMQVAKATGKPFTSPAEVRAFLVNSATDVPNVLQADRRVNVGPQLNVGRTVERLLEKAGIHGTPDVSRIAVAQRYPANLSDFLFTTDTDPNAIDLTGTLGETGTFGPCDPGCTAFQPITIAPDWEDLPPGTRFKVLLDGKPIAAPGPWIRLYPGAILKAARLPLYSSQTRKVALTYLAYSGPKLLAQTSTVLTFLSNEQTLTGMGPPPVVPPVVTGRTITVHYDLRDENPGWIVAPELVVSVPDRASFASPGYHQIWSAPLTAKQGSIEVPVSALQGDGIYGIAISANSPQINSSTWAYTRVANAGSARPPAPLLSVGTAVGTTVSAGHTIDVPYRGSFQVSWDASSVPHATGAMLEIGAPGPTLFGNYNPFNNPNGSMRDNNGIDSGSQMFVALPGVSGTTTISSASLLSAEYQGVRIIPMAGSTAVGEASDVSTVVTHGIQTSDGGGVLGGFEINPQGTDGMLTSNQLDGGVSTSPLCAGQINEVVTSSFQSIDLTANAVGATVKQATAFVPLCQGFPQFGAEQYYAMNGLSFDPASDSAFGLEGSFFNALTGGNLVTASADWFSGVATYAAAPVGGTGAAGFVLPIPVSEQSPTLGDSGALHNVSNGEYLYQLGPQDPQVFNATISGLGTQKSFIWGTGLPYGNYINYAPTFGFAAVNPSLYPGSGDPGFAIMGGDTLLAGQPGLGPFLDVLNLTTGKASTITNLVTGDTMVGLALVPNGNAPPQYVATLNVQGAEVGFYDFAAGALASKSPTTGSWPAAITSMQGTSGTGYVAVLSTFSPGFVGAGSYYYDGNDNALSGVDVVAPNGADSFIATSNLYDQFLEGLGYGVPFPSAASWIGFNKQTQTLYVLGPNGDEIQVIPTSGF